MPEYSNRSNDPRVTGALKGMTKDDYHFALEVARQPASTAWEKKMQKKAANYARAYESRFPKAAFVQSDRSPLSAGGKGAYKDPEKVNMSTKDPFAKKSTASKVAGAAGKIAGKAAGVAKAGAKALAKPPRPTRQVAKGKPIKPLIKKLKNK